MVAQTRCNDPLAPMEEAVLAILRCWGQQDIVSLVRQGDAKADVARRYGLIRAAVPGMALEDAM